MAQLLLDSVRTPAADGDGDPADAGTPEPAPAK